jgi:uncharacterized membrane protein YgcG
MLDRAFARFSRWVFDQLIGDVPENILICECICRLPQCTGWKSCEFRLKQAAGSGIQAGGGEAGGGGASV